MAAISPAPSKAHPHPFGLEVDLDSVLEYVEDDVRALGDSRILLTGGTGFVGTWLLEVLTWSADRLGTSPRAVVLTRNPARFGSRRPHLARHRTVTLVEGDVRTSVNPPSGPFDLAIAGASANLAAGDGSSDQDVFDTQVAGAEMARACLDRYDSRVLLLSSGAARQAGADAYSEAKRGAERIVSGTGATKSAVIARLFTFVGPYLPLDVNFAVGNFLGDVLEGRPISVKGDGSSVRSYLYSADLAWWLWALLVRGAPGEIYEVGAPEPVSIAALATQLSGFTQPPTPVEIAGKAVRSAAGDRYIPDISAAGRVGLTVTWSLEEALRRTYEWHRARRER